MAKVKTIDTAAFNIALSACVPIVIFEIAWNTAWYLLIGTLLISFFSIYFFSRFFFRQFVVYKMKPIYRMVTSQSVSTRSLNEKLASGGSIMDEVRDELAVWSEKRETEIARAEDRERFQREFIGNLSHEIKTPIFTIQGYLLTLLDGALDDPEINQLYLERAAKSLERLTNILTDLDEITKMESGEKLTFSVFDIKELARDVFSVLEFEAQRKGIKLKLGPTSKSKIWVYADRDKIEQVLVNLVSNSIKYGNPKGCTRINFIDMYEETMIEVEDNGIGIAEEDQKRLFERFYRVDKSRSRESGGTGLGLAIVKHIIDSHRGQLSVRSELDKGSVFSFTVRKPSKKEA